MTNPATISPNTGRTFAVGSRYWLRVTDQYVMPRENSRYEQPKGFIPVVAISETELARDAQPLDAVPRNLDPTNPHHVGAAVTAEGIYRMEDKPQPVPMPVTMPNAMDDHQVRERSERALAAAAAMASTTPGGDPTGVDLTPNRRKPRSNQ